MNLMKQRSTTPVSKGLATRSALVAAAVLVAFSIPVTLGQRVLADKYDDQIRALQQEIGGYQAQAAALNAQAQTLQSELAGLAAEKATIQGQIDLSQAKYDKLVHDIAETEQKIADNKAALGQIIADMYVDGTISPLEMLASSKNIGDYVDQQEYRSSIQTNLSQTIDKINTLKKQLETQKKDVELVLADQKSQRDALAAKEAEQAKLLADTQGQESAYQQLSSQRNAQVNSLRAQQAAELAARARSTGGGYSVSSDGSNGGYPSLWANSAQDTLVDSWGMYNRECVSYVAFKVAQAYGNMPYWGGRGNANQWPSNARAAGIPTGTTPRAGAVGVVSSGAYGHVAWVESVNGDGTINISHYNVNWSGNYARWWNLDPSFFDTYIYFGG
jgi:surface antigen